MAEKTFRNSPPKPDGAERPDPEDRMPTHAELLYELRRHGAKPPPRREPRGLSRRTRDFLLIAGLGSAGIFLASFKLLPDSDTFVILRLALTGAGLFSGLLWFIFYGVMSRY
jgi:hypothetical protein